VISFLLPTVGRPSLEKTLASIECWPGDEILLISSSPRSDDPRVRFIPCAPGKNWGHAERNYATPFATGRYLAHIDDDDVYVPGHRALMDDAITQTPDRPVLFKMQYPKGSTLWSTPDLRMGNVGTPMMLIPNQPKNLGTWGQRCGGDCFFLQSMRWKAHEIVWRPEVIALLGHD